MKLSAVFYNETCRIELFPENKWEKRLLGAVAGKTGVLKAEAEIKHEGHFSYEQAEVVRVVITSTAHEDQVLASHTTEN